MMRVLNMAVALLLIGAPVAALAADSSNPVSNTQSPVTPGNQNNTGSSAQSPSKDTAPSGAAVDMNRGTNQSTAKGDTSGTGMNRTDQANSAEGSDSWITTKTKSALLADKNTSAAKVHVTTKDGIVTLTGKVANKEAKQAAEQDARNIKGVKDVVNHLVVASNRTASQ